MPEETSVPIPDSKAAQPLPRRLGIGINVLLQIVLSLAIFGAINRLNYRHYWRFDLSPSQDFTLSESTLSYLDTLTKDVQIYIVFARDSKVYGEVQSLLDEYRLHGKQRVRVRSIDPVRDIERAESLKSETGLSLAQNGILVMSGVNKRFITEDELVIRDTGTSTNKQIVEFRGEDAVTSALANVMEGRLRRFYYIVGKGSRSDQALLDSMEVITELGRQQNFEMVPVNLSEIGGITKDADGVLLMGARYDFSEREIGMLSDYWNGERAGVMLLLDPNRNTPNLDKWLATVGVRPRGDRVVVAMSTSTGVKKEFSVQAEFSRDVSFTRHLSSTMTTFTGQTESLELRDSEDPAMRERSIVVKPMIIASKNFWGETKYLEDLPVAEEEDTLPPVYVGASVERGASQNESKSIDSSRLVVVSNPSLLDKGTMLAVNRDFMAASLNWIINREKWIGITAKPKRSYRIQLTPKQHKVIFWISSLAMPGVVLALGFMVWAGRRAA